MSLLTNYSSQILAFHMKGEPQFSPTAPLGAEQIAHKAGRCIAMALQGEKGSIVFFGAGSNTLANAIAQQAPAHLRLVLVEQNMAAARHMMPSLHTRWERMADSSPWACLCLLAKEGITAQNSHLYLNPELDKGLREPPQQLQRLMARIILRKLKQDSTPQPALSAAAILSPAEPNLDTFFSQFPHWLHELCIVWDAKDVPSVPVPHHLTVRQIAHPLDDFSAQRNRMLSLCTGDYVIYLDGDEQLQTDNWALLPQLCAEEDLAGFHFPRHTLYPDPNHVKIGMGLWPDLQLRLFRRTPAIRFERPIHEHLKGICGNTAIALDIPLFHYSRLRKNQQELEAKLARFDTAAQKKSFHTLNKEYPHFNGALLAKQGAKGHCRLLQLPPDVLA